MSTVANAKQIRWFRNLRFLFAGLGLAAMTAASTGCGVERVLRVDAEEYNFPVGGIELNGLIPGIPEDDRIENAFGGVSITDDDDVFESRVLRIAGGELDLVPADHEEPDEYEINWEGFRTWIASSGNSTIAFFDDDGEQAFEMRFDGDTGVLRLIGGDEFQPSVDVGGTFTHEITLIFDLSIRRVTLIYQEANDYEPEEHTGLSFIDNGFDTLGRIRIEAADNGPYLMRDIDVFAKTDQR